VASTPQARTRINSVKTTWSLSRPLAPRPSAAAENQVVFGSGRAAIADMTTLRNKLPAGILRRWHTGRAALRQTGASRNTFSRNHWFVQAAAEAVARCETQARQPRSRDGRKVIAFAKEQGWLTIRKRGAAPERSRA